MFLNSIRWKIQAWHGLLLTVLVTGLLFAFYGYERRERMRVVDNQLGLLLTPLLPRLMPAKGPPRRNDGRQDGPPENRKKRSAENPNDRFDGRPDMQDGKGKNRPPPPPPPQPNDRELDRQFWDYFNAPPEPDDRPAVLLDRMPAPIESGVFYYVQWTEKGEQSKKSVGAPAEVAYPGPGVPGSEPELRTREGFRELIHYGPQESCLVLGTSVTGIHQQLQRLAWELTAAGLAVVAVGLAGGWWLADRAIRPIAQISAVAGTIAAGDLTRRINVEETESELGQMAGVLNNTFDRLEKTFDQQTRFTADASHELRTPISVILTQIQLALSRERSPEELRHTLATCERAATRMRTLVNQLLELARVDSGEFELTLEPCDLSRIARESLELIEPLAQEKKITVRQNLVPVTAIADAMKLSQVLVNLLNNAILHNPAGIEVSVSLEASATHATLRVKDTGVGIPPETVPHIFERFYRVDKSRTRAKGSTGLGLSISKAIIEAHGGTISVNSEQGKGSEFVIELPLAGVAVAEVK